MVANNDISTNVQQSRYAVYVQPENIIDYDYCVELNIYMTKELKARNTTIDFIMDLTLSSTFPTNSEMLAKSLSFLRSPKLQRVLVISKNKVFRLVMAVVCQRTDCLVHFFSGQSEAWHFLRQKTNR